MGHVHHVITRVLFSLSALKGGVSSVVVCFQSMLLQLIICWSTLQTIFHALLTKDLETTNPFYSTPYSTTGTDCPVTEYNGFLHRVCKFWFNRKAIVQCYNSKQRYEVIRTIPSTAIVRRDYIFSMPSSLLLLTTFGPNK